MTPAEQGQEQFMRRGLTPDESDELRADRDHWKRSYEAKLREKIAVEHERLKLHVERDEAVKRRDDALRSRESMEASFRVQIKNERDEAVKREKALVEELAEECENRMRIHERQRDPTGERLWDELEHKGAVRALAGMARVIRRALDQSGKGTR